MCLSFLNSGSGTSAPKKQGALYVFLPVGMPELGQPCLYRDLDHHLFDPFNHLITIASNLSHRQSSECLIHSSVPE